MASPPYGSDPPRVVERFPHPVRELENVWIPMADGARLAARLWLPGGAERRPVPAVVEYLPYRKRDGTRSRDEAIHHYFAGHGYASARVDLRGTGDSDGLLADEYTEQEQRDGLEVLAWIARQSWCDGAVGMIGKSWGGFNSLQIAALAPPELRAVVTVCSTDDRYADDAHYMGGCLLLENFTWGAMLFTLAALPPDPQIVGGAWRAGWRRRLAALPLFSANWLRHPRRDDYWKHGSVCEDYSAIRCPVFAAGGWADGYTNSVPRLLAGLEVPRIGLVGPWAHTYPHDGVPGPAIGFLQECLRWWERWLAGVDNGIEREPRYRAWMQEPAPADPLHHGRPGRWVAEDDWPSARIETLRLVPNAGGLGERAEHERALPFSSPQTVGMEAGAWCGFGLEGELPGDQRADDAGSLVLDGEPLASRLELLGAPELELELASDRPAALLAVRLCDLAPDGSSERVSYGLLNLTHRDGHEEPRPLLPGERFRLRLALGHAAHAFTPGHRLRLALSTSYWPIAWPPPEPATLTLFAGRGALLLPIRPPRAADADLRPFDPPETAARPSELDIDPGGVRRRVETDPATGELVLTVELDTAAAGAPALSRLETIDLVQGHGIVERFRIHPEDPLSARLEIEHEALLARDDWSVRIRTRTRLSATAEHFRLEAELEAFEDEERVAHRRFDERVRRDGV